MAEAGAAPPVQAGVAWRPGPCRPSVGRRPWIELRRAVMPLEPNPGRRPIGDRGWRSEELALAVLVIVGTIGFLTPRRSLKTLGPRDTRERTPLAEDSPRGSPQRERLAFGQGRPGSLSAGLPSRPSRRPHDPVLLGWPVSFKPVDPTRTVVGKARPALRVRQRSAAKMSWSGYFALLS